MLVFCQLYVIRLLNELIFTLVCFNSLQLCNKVDINKNEVSSQMYQRSEDMDLGVPFNIVLCSSYAHNYLNPKLE
jgi:hypothetical protein